jgi:predicted nuclease of predicted toxin-antitoxin system
MRLAANENIPGAAVAALRAAGHDVSWVVEDAPASPDARVLARAVTEKRILLTFDKDFGHLAFHAGLPADCGIVLLRIRRRSEVEVVQQILSLFSGEDRWTGTFTVGEADGRLRQRSLPKPHGDDEPR